MRGILIYGKFDLKHIQGTLSNIKNGLNEIDVCCQGGDERKKLSMILSGKGLTDY
jgi:hypothetical protein